MRSFRRLFLAFVAVVATTAALPARAASPDHTVTIVVPFPPGGSTDMIARVLAAKLQEQLHQTFVIDNRAGATGTIGMGMVKRAAPDGYTLIVSSLGPFVITPHLIKNLPYDIQKDIDLLSVLVQAPNVLVVPASSPYRSVDDVVAALKQTPNKITFASSGNGSSDHLTAELFWQRTGTHGLHVPYKGGAPALNDLLGGVVQASFQNINVVLPHVAAGKLRALAVTGNRRSPLLANVPTLAESGVKGADVYSWQAIAAPKGLAPDVKKTLSTSIIAALNDPEVKPRLLDLGFEIVASTPEQFAAMQAAEYARWKTVIETGKITAD